MHVLVKCRGDTKQMIQFTSWKKKKKTNGEHRTKKAFKENKIQAKPKVYFFNQAQRTHVIWRGEKSRTNSETQHTPTNINKLFTIHIYIHTHNKYLSFKNTYQKQKTATK